MNLTAQRSDEGLCSNTELSAFFLVFALQVAEKCLGLGAQKALYIAADMSNDTDPGKVVDFALEKLGGLDYLVLNHIGPSPFRMWEGDVEHVKWLMQVVQHPAHVCHYVCVTQHNVKIKCI